MTSGRQLRLLRSLSRGDLYEGAAALIVGVTDKRMRVIANEAIREGLITRDEHLVLRITSKGQELVEAYTP